MESKEERRRKNAERMKSRYAAKKAAGLCVDCGKAETMPNSVYCYDCWEKEYDYKQKRVYTDEEIAKRNKRQNERRQEWAKQGLCHKCGKRPPIKGHVKCLECHIYERRATIEASRDKSASNEEIRRYRLENHLCTKCGKPAKDGFKVCQYHYNVSIANVKKGRETVKREHIW